jgi:hypothetical protein
MSAKKPSPKKSRKTSVDPNNVTSKALGLFDHVNHIKGVQDPKYFDTLTDADKKSFTHTQTPKLLLILDSL